MILTCTRALKAPVCSLSEKEIKESIEFVKKWIDSGNYSYDIKFLFERLKDLQEVQEFGGINVNE